MIIRLSFLLLTFLATIFSARAQAERPKLVVNIVISQMRYDYMSRFRHNFAERGFRTLINDGASCTNAYYNFTITNTPAGISTIVSGSNPSSHGIVAEQWINYTNNEMIDVIADPKVLAIGCDESDGKFSPHRLTASTIGDEMRQRDPNSRVISVALDPTSAILSGGYMASGAYWLDMRQGTWSTSNYYHTNLQDWIKNFNKAEHAQTQAATEWVISLPRDKYVLSQSTDIKTQSEKSGISFDIFSRKSAPDCKRLLDTPFGDDLVTNFAIGALVNEKMGQGSSTDMLFITFDSPRYIGRKYGTESVEIEDTYYRLDKNIADLLTAAESQVGKENLLVVVTSDHGASDPCYPTSNIPSGIFEPKQFAVLVNGFLGAQYGVNDWVVAYMNNQIYLNRSLIYTSGLNLVEMQHKVVSFATQFRGVVQAMSATALQNNSYTGTVGKMQNSYYQRHSGDILVNFLPGWIEGLEGNECLSSAGTGYEYDTHVPLFWYGKNISHNTIYDVVDMCDVAPTMSHILRIDNPNTTTGRTIEKIHSRFTDN